MLVSNLSTKNWMAIKRDILKNWTNITLDKLDDTKGDLQKIKNLVINAYGNNKNIMDDVDRIYNEALMVSNISKVSESDDFDEDNEATMLNPSLENISSHELEINRKNTNDNISENKNY